MVKHLLGVYIYTLFFHQLISTQEMMKFSKTSQLSSNKIPFILHNL